MNHEKTRSQTTELKNYVPITFVRLNVKNNKKDKDLHCTCFYVKGNQCPETVI